MFKKGDNLSFETVLADTSGCTGKITDIAQVMLQGVKVYRMRYICPETHNITDKKAPADMARALFIKLIYQSKLVISSTGIFAYMIFRALALLRAIFTSETICIFVFLSIFSDTSIFAWSASSSDSLSWAMKS